jgi:hypothetical protein
MRVPNSISPHQFTNFRSSLAVFGVADQTQQYQQRLPTATDAASWSVLAAAGVWLLRQCWEWFITKEKGESELTRVLIDDLRSQRERLQAINVEGFAATVDSIKSLDKNLQATQHKLDIDLQAALRSQATIMVATNQSIGDLKRLVESLHNRLDGMSVISPSAKSRVGANDNQY